MRQLAAVLGLALALTIGLPRPAAADSIAQTWEVGEEPFGIAVDPTDGRIFVANSRYPSFEPPGPGSITIVDPSSNQTRTLATSGPADLLALDAVHRRLYSSNADHSLQVFDLDTLALIARLPVGGLGVAVDPTTQRVYVVDRTAAGSFLTVVDGVTNTVVETKYAPTPEIWWGLALDAAHHRLYVTNINANPYSVPAEEPSLVVLDDRDLSLIADVSFPVITRFALAIDEVRDRVYLGGYDPTGQFANSRFYALDGPSLQVLASTPIPGFPGGIALVPAAHQIYITNPGNNSGFGSGYRVLDDQTYAVVETASTAPYDPYTPVLHIDGDIYFGAWSSGPDVLIRVRDGNSAPVITSATLAPPAPMTNDVLLASVSASDSDLPDLTGSRVTLTYTYEWSRNGQVIAGATTSTLDLGQPGVGERGDTISIRVTASDGQASSAPAVASVVVADTAPTSMVALDSASPGTDQLITASVTSSDPDGDPLTYTFTWKVDGAVRAVTSGPSASSSFDLAVAGNGDRGQTVSVEVVASDGTLQSAAASASAVVANTPPTVTVSLSDATPQTRDLLVATASAQDADADTLTLTYAWTVNGVVKQIGGSNSFNLAVKGQGDNGDVITVTATASDGSATATAIASATVTPGRGH